MIVVPRFYPIVDTVLLRARGWDVRRVAETLLATGAKILQYRHKDAWTQPGYDEAEVISKLCAEAKAQFVINDRADFAKLLNAGLHLGQDDLPPAAAREILGGALLGFSTHNKRQISFGADEPVDYLSLGPIYPTASKQNPDPVVGLEGLTKLRPLATKPLVAIGGIQIDSAGAVFAAGADSVAVISGFLPAEISYGELAASVKEWLMK